MRKIYKGLAVALFACAVPVALVGCGGGSNPPPAEQPPAFEAVSYAAFEKFMTDVGTASTFDNFVAEKTVNLDGEEIGRVTTTTTYVNSTRRAAMELKVDKKVEGSHSKDWEATVYYQFIDGGTSRNAYINESGSKRVVNVNLVENDDSNQRNYFLVKENLLEHLQNYTLAKKVVSPVGAALKNTAIARQENGATVTFKFVYTVENNIDGGGKQTIDTTYTVVFNNKKLENFSVVTTQTTKDAGGTATSVLTTTQKASAYAGTLTLPEDLNTYPVG